MKQINGPSVTQRTNKQAAWLTVLSLTAVGWSVFYFTTLHRSIPENEPPPAHAEDAQLMMAGPGAPSGVVKIELKELRPDMAGQEVRVTGRVASIREPAEADSKAPYEVILKEGAVEVHVVYWSSVAARLKHNKPMMGSLVQVEGTLENYKNMLQIRIPRAEKIALLDVTPVSMPVVNKSEIIDIGSITRAQLNNHCTVRGQLGEPQSIRSGVKYPLTDRTGKIVLLLWDKNVQGENRNALTAGVTVVVNGTVTEYKGVLELVPSSDQGLLIERSE
jgi:DNA/RNA endonuclease YhcR with UshA esterase domain